MNKKLPARPNLDHLKGQAKALLAQFQSQDSVAITAFREQGLDSDKAKLADAQFVVARQGGFASWPKLVHYVETLNALEGTWVFVTLQLEGNAIPGEALTHSKLVINGDRFNTLSPEADYLGVFDIDVEATPTTIDIDFIEGPEAGNSSYGIFRLEKNELTICLGLTGASRPEDFVSRPGTGHALETLRRVTSDAPVIEPIPPGPGPELLTGDPSDFERVTPEMEALHGEWLALEIVNSGAAVPKQFLSHGSRVCEGSRTTVVFGGQKMVDVFFQIPAPRHIDYLVASGPNKNKLQEGIYELDGEILRVAMGPVGMGRPNELQSTPGDGVTYSVWKRK